MLGEQASRHKSRSDTCAYHSYVCAELGFVSMGFGGVQPQSCCTQLPLLVSNALLDLNGCILAWPLFTNVTPFWLNE